MAKGFYARKHQLGRLPDNDTGFATHRRREYAIICQDMMNWKLRRLNWNTTKIMTTAQMLSAARLSTPVMRSAMASCRGTKTLLSASKDTGGGAA